MTVKHGVHPAYRDKPEVVPTVKASKPELVPKADKSKPEEVPDASERASFHRGATKERMEDRGESLAEMDKKAGGTGTVSGHAVLRTAQSARDSVDKSRMRRIGNEAATAAEYEDKASGRKKKD